MLLAKRKKTSKSILLNSLFTDEELKSWEPQIAACPKESLSTKSETGLGRQTRSFSNSQPSCSRHFSKQQAQQCDHAVVSVFPQGAGQKMLKAFDPHVSTEQYCSTLRIQT